MDRISKKSYAIQPYLVGPKQKKSLAVIIPSKLAKEFGVNTSTIFATYVDKNDNTISLRMIREANKDAVTHTGESLSL
jgi:antitoxin component of MazEF toxin-antitoxin module